MTAPIELFQVPLAEHRGIENMALDDGLLEHVRAIHDRTLYIIRTYTWSTMTVSLGTHQPKKDCIQLHAQYQHLPQLDWVIRPTGGRAILHGNDISFSLTTNDPQLCRQSIHQSYCFLTKIVKQVLLEMALPLEEACESNPKDYVRSANCFETVMPSDLKTPSGEKIVGSAQLRRANGLLQHGSIALTALNQNPMQFNHTDFHQRLCQATAQALGKDPSEPIPLWPKLVASDYPEELHRYETEAQAILESISTSMGSHR